MVDVTNIRDTGQFADAGGVQVAGVYFDGALVIDGVTKGAGVDGVPALNQIGYVQLTPESSGGPLTPAQYQQLIQNVGLMGGTVDCTIDVAGSGLHENRTRRSRRHSGHGRPRVRHDRLGKPAISNWCRAVVLPQAGQCRSRSRIARLRPRRATHPGRRCSGATARKFALPLCRSGRFGGSR